MREFYFPVNTKWPKTICDLCIKYLPEINLIILFWLSKRFEKFKSLWDAVEM